MSSIQTPNIQLNRWTPVALRNGMRARNRVVVPPMASQTADPSGCISASTLSHYERLGLAGVGIVIVEYTYVHPSGRSEERQLGISSAAHQPGLAALAKAIQRTGALAGIQLTHAGAKTQRRWTGGVLLGASALPVPVKEGSLEKPDAMSADDLELWKTSFIQAADRAVSAGFELVELHAAHGYGLNQWLSPLTNQRTDAYGGGPGARMKLLLEIVSRIRAQHPELLISVRIPGQEFMDGGLQVGDSIELALALERAGVDLIHVSSGIGGWRRPGDRVGEGYLVSEAAEIQSRVALPVIGVGGIETGAYIDESLQSGRFSFAAVGRAILKDPVAWRERELKRGAVQKGTGAGLTDTVSKEEMDVSNTFL